MLNSQRSKILTRHIKYLQNSILPLYVQESICEHNTGISMEESGKTRVLGKICEQRKIYDNSKNVE